jgi:uncharacterized protein
MLKRDAYQDMLEWKRLKTHQGLLVTGARQVGKTTLVREFAHQNYKELAEINFLENPQAIQIVQEATNSKDLLLRLSVLTNSNLEPEKTLLFLDEIQECKDILTWLKFLAEANNIDIVLSGSLLGVGLFNVRSYPVGFVQQLEMHPFSFKEFCQACDFPQSAMGTVAESFQKRMPVPDYIHNKLMELFYKYLLVGGMPDAVSAFVKDGTLPRVRNVQRALFDAYEGDITKYVESPVERRHIKTIYEAIPNQLNHQNKRFKFNKLGENSRFSHMQTAFDWLENAGIALPTLRVQDPLYQLGQQADTSSFKLFMNDVGLLTSRLMSDTDLQILSGKATINFGSIFENAAAQELVYAGHDLFYYNSNRVGEVDFLIQNTIGEVSLVEIKSGKDYKRHRAMTGLLRTQNYSFKHAFVFHNGNVQCEDKVEYLPIYMIMFV